MHREMRDDFFKETYTGLYPKWSHSWILIIISTHKILIINSSVLLLQGC